MRMDLWMRLMVILPIALTAVSADGANEPEVLYEADFSRPLESSAWVGAHDIGGIEFGEKGMRIQIAGADPYLFGPILLLPAGAPLWLELRMQSDQGGSAQVFYFEESRRPSEEDSARFSVAAGRQVEVKIPLPGLWRRTRLRFDPPGSSGKTILQTMRLVRREFFSRPEWPRPEAPAGMEDPLVLQSGEVELRHARGRWNGFEIQVDGRGVAAGNPFPKIGYVREGKSIWFPEKWGSESGEVETFRRENALIARWQVRDPDGAVWQWEREFHPHRVPGTIAVTTRVKVNRDRTILYLPWLTVQPGLGSFGREKTQGLFAGVEYLAGEPSGSEADLRGPLARRLVPDTLMITFPLMAIHHDGRYIGLSWEMQPDTAAVFDSPDRTFGSNGHLMALISPGSNGTNRDPASLLPYAGIQLTADTTYTQHARILGGRSPAIIGAVRHYVKCSGLPALPRPIPSRDDYLRLAGSGWLDSKIREGNRFRHAVWHDRFPPLPAGDAAAMMHWLAGRMGDAELSRRLNQCSRTAMAELPKRLYNLRTVGHVPTSSPCLVFGEVPANLNAAASRGREVLNRLEPDGSMIYRPAPGETDFGTTHFSREASGLTGQVLQEALRLGAFSGDREVIDQGVFGLEAAMKFLHQVPRGAQTWEIPLHTPDILAAAHLVHAYTLGYELTGRESFLEAARYWAWTGVPFIYLRAPTPGEVGAYATIPVLGATGWASPVWLGRPVQWCGLVYADALRQLARHDSPAFWGRLADGITASGIQQTWPRTDPERQGLLPDYYLLRPQMRDGPAINPATLQVNAIPFYTRKPAADFMAFHHDKLWVFAPGKIIPLTDSLERLEFQIAAWPQGKWFLVIHGVPTGARITAKYSPIKSIPTSSAPPNTRVLQLDGHPTITVHF